MKKNILIACFCILACYQTPLAQPSITRTNTSALIRPATREKMPALNGIMKVDSLWESITRINTNNDLSLLIVHSEVPNLIFESNRLITRVDPKSSGYTEVWLPYGTHRIKIDAAGFQRLELPTQNFARKRAYEMKIFGILKNQRSSTDKGTLVLTSTPDGASIKIDGFPNFKGTTPYELKDYATGTYMVTLTKEKYETREALVLVEKDKVLTENLKLVAKFGFLTVTSSQQVEVVVDDQRFTPESGKPFEVRTGIHKISILAGGRSLKDTTVVIPPETTVQLTAGNK